MSNEIVYPDTENIITPDDPKLEEDNDDDDDSEIIEYDGHPCCNPSHALHRYFALTFMCLLGLGSSFCSCNPGALQDHIIKDMHLTTFEFMDLYFLYFLPNLACGIAGGFLINRVFGVRVGAVICAAIVLIGQICFALGGVLNMFWLMKLGRFVLGIGGESLALAQNGFAVLWFKGKELNMVFGLQHSFARIGSIVNFLVMEPLYNLVGKTYNGYMCTGVVLFIAASTCIVSLVCGVILGFMDQRAERIFKRQSDDDDDDDDELVPADEEVSEPDSCKTFWKAFVNKFPAIFWLVSIVCAACYGAIFSFIALGKVFFEKKFGFSPDDANTVISIFYISSAVTSPILGYLIDKVGKNVFWVFLSILVSIGCHALLAFTFVNPYVAMCTLGIAYSILASALWPMVALIIPEHQPGTAYELVLSWQHIGLGVISTACGGIVDSSGYLLLEVFLIGCLCVALITSVVVWVLDANSYGVLNMTAFQRDIFALIDSNRLLADVISERRRLWASGRHRYLSRIGEHLPHYYTIKAKGFAYQRYR